jgi:hypothetical protein
MFLGHFALGFAAKKIEPSVSLATAIGAAQLADLVWPVFLLSGLERVAIAPGDTPVTPLRFESYPYSHSLVALILWGLAFGALHFAVWRKPRAAVLLGLLVVSHWVLDVASHRPDMPLLPWGETRLGLGLWYSVPATLVVEAALFAGGVAVYLSATRARDAVGRFALAGFVAFLGLVYVGNLFGPPPPSVVAVAWAGLLGAGLLLAWAAWVDRHRLPR